MNIFTPLTKEQAVLAIINLSKSYDIQFSEDQIAELANYTVTDQLEKFNALIGDKILESEIVMLLVCVSTNNHQTLVPINKIICNHKIDPPDVDNAVIRERKWIFTLVNKKDFINNDLPLFIGTSLWVCNCKKDFIRTKFHTKCEKCGTLQTKPNTQYASLPDLFKEKSN